MHQLSVSDSSGLSRLNNCLHLAILENSSVTEGASYGHNMLITLCKDLPK